MTKLYQECNICGGKGAIIGSKRDVKVLQCPECSFLWKDPETLSENYWKTWKKEVAIGEDFRNQTDIFKHRINTLKKHSKTKINKILDLGCGKGNLVYFLRNNGYEAYGCDIHPETPNDPYFFHQKLASMPIDNFDLIISVETFEHLANPKHMMQLLAEKTKPGGLLCIQTHYTHTKTLFGWGYFNYAEHVSFYPPKAMRKLMKNVGVDLIHYDKKKQPFYLSGFLARNLVHLWCRFFPFSFKDFVWKAFNRPRIGQYEDVNKKKAYLKDMLKIANCVYIGRKL